MILLHSSEIPRFEQLFPFVFRHISRQRMCIEVELFILTNKEKEIGIKDVTIYT